MTTPDVRAFYATLGIQLRAAAAPNATVRCFAQPDAHQHDDRSPSCSISLTSGAWNCHGCGARGGAYDAALATGNSPRSAMELVIAHGLADRRRPERQPTSRRAPHAGPPAKAAPAPAAVTPRAADEHNIASWAATLEDNSRLTRRLALERAWGIRVIRQLQIGFDGARITIPIRDAHGAPQGVCRYDPFGTREPKMLALPGTRLGLIPHPAQIAQKHLVLVEGPPDMIAARTCGLAAIAVPGTSAWQPHWAKLLRGKHVKLVLDCDAAGRRAAQQIHACLRAAAITSEIIDLWPDRHDGYDLTDRIVELKRQRPGLTAAAVASLLATVPTVHRKRARSHARVTQEAAR
jgi:hypothetical protein